MKKYVHEQVAVRRDVKNVSKGPVPMDINLSASNFIASLEGWGQEEGKAEDHQCEPCGGESFYGGGCGSQIEDQVFSFVSNLKGNEQKGGERDAKGNGAKGSQGSCNFCGQHPGAGKTQST